MSRLLQFLILAYLPLAARHLPLGASAAHSATASTDADRTRASLLA